MPIKKDRGFTLEDLVWAPTEYAVGLSVTPDIKKVIFNEPVTIILWSDRTKTVVKCQEGDTFDKELGMAMAISKKFFKNKGNYNEQFKKWCYE